MCNPAATIEHKNNGDSDHNNNKESSSIMSKIWPLPTPLVLALLPFLPQSFYINRGYTVWFHLTSIIYFLTRSPFVRKILILQGLGICLGWYSAISYDWFVEGTFCHSLYRNMPSSMLPYMLQELGGEGPDSYVMLETHSSYAMKILSHILDTIGHPILAYFFYNLHTNKWGGSWKKDILTWPTIVSAWHISRMWSMVHSYYNTGSFRFWYYGHDVYRLNNLDCYLIAYVMEGFVFGVAILCRVYWDVCEGRGAQQSKLLSGSTLLSVEKKKKELQGERMPSLIHSESAMSTASMM